MAFKMKGPMFFKSALKNYNKMSKYSSKAVEFGEDETDPAFKHYVDDNPEHQETYGDHSDDLQTEEEHKAAKDEGKKKKDNLSQPATERIEAVGDEPSPVKHTMSEKTNTRISKEQANKHNKSKASSHHSGDPHK